MTKKFLILLIVTLNLTLITAQQRWFPSENGLISIPVSDEWSEVIEESNDTYAIYTALKGVMKLELYIAGGEPIPPKEHLDSFLDGVDRQARSFSYYTREVYNSYFMETVEQYIATGTKTIDGEERRFVARSYFPDMYGVLLIVSVPEDLGNLYLAEMKTLLQL